MTPIFIRIWLMKMTRVRDLLIEAVSLRSAWLISRAWRPGSESPISPSSSARGTSAATLSITSTSSAPERTQCVGDLQRLLARVRLGDQQLLQIDAELARIGRVERMLGIDEGAGAAGLLRFSDGVQRQRRLARTLRPVDLDHPPARQAADPEPDVEPERASRNRLGLHRRLALAELHDRALAERALDLPERRFQRALLLRPVLLLRHRHDIMGHMLAPRSPGGRFFASGPFTVPLHRGNISGTQEKIS